MGLLQSYCEHLVLEGCAPLVNVEVLDPPSCFPLSGRGIFFFFPSARVGAMVFVVIFFFLSLIGHVFWPFGMLRHGSRAPVDLFFRVFSQIPQGELTFPPPGRNCASLLSKVNRFEMAAPTSSTPLPLLAMPFFNSFIIASPE